VSAINLLVAFYDSHGRMGEVLFFCSVCMSGPPDKAVLLINLLIDSSTLDRYFSKKQCYFLWFLIKKDKVEFRYLCDLVVLSTLLYAHEVIEILLKR
jgi:hypothetical protein